MLFVRTQKFGDRQNKQNIRSLVFYAIVPNTNVMQSTRAFGVRQERSWFDKNIQSSSWFGKNVRHLTGMFMVRQECLAFEKNKKMFVIRYSMVFLNNNSCHILGKIIKISQKLLSFREQVDCSCYCQVKQ